ncbi:hypothetical protein AMST5_01921 [freshwater sediment metagenome]|uniref:Prohead serine protease domain-containing protein n=1 Tax=freshwater sediment metagenome TaxID=556182 RepID=A0AA48M3J8_9ZZZZ
MERRACSIELRTAGAFPRRLEGYAAVFETETRIGDFVETIRAGAFKDTLSAGRDILALADHDTRALLARTRSGTLKLAEDTRGLHFEISLPDTALGRDLHALAERGDIGGASFGFTVPKGGEAWSGNRRELRAVDLAEISIVQSWPAYQNTVVEARFRNVSKPADAGLRRSLAQWRA